MKEVIQLSLTEEESIILMSTVAVGVVVHLRDIVIFERAVRSMEFWMDKWPEASTFLADKMSNLVGVHMEIEKAKG